MRKITLLLAASFAFAASALPVQPRQLPLLPDNDQFRSVRVDLQPMQNAPAREEAGEDLTMNYSPADEPYSALGFNNVTAGCQIGMAFELTAADATKFADNRITAVNFYTGLNTTTGVNQIATATVFLSTDLQSAPFYTQVASLPSTRYTYVDVPLDEPYTIEAGKSVYVGYIVTLTDPNDYCVVIDYMSHGTNVQGGWVGTQNPGEKSMSWMNIAQSYGFVCIGATIVGQNLPKNELDVTDVVTDPTLEQNVPFDFEFDFTNMAANDVTSIEVEYTLGDQEPVTGTVSFQQALAYKKSAYVTVPDVIYPSSARDGMDIKVKVTKVNGETNNSTNNEASTNVVVLPQGKGYERNVVIEEFTGTWCGYCPLGIVTMEALRDLYPDGGLIPVAIHVQGSPSDPMVSTSYNQVASYYSTGGVPGAVMNRQYSVYPELDNVEYLYSALSAVPTVGTVSATAEHDEDPDYIVVSTKTAFSFDYDDADSRYALSFGITEDNVGPYSQHNYYGGSGEDIGGWENLGEWVSGVYYNDVARQLTTFSGVNGSIPAEVNAGEEYTFEYRFKLISAVSDKNNINVVVYLLNKESGAVENATTIKTADIGMAGVEDIVVDNDNNAPVEYFNLQGIRVANPENGLYIRRQGNTVTKVAL